MNRAIPAAIITAVGLGALASFKSTTGLPTKSAAAVVVPRTTTPASAASSGRTTTAPRSTGRSTPATVPATTPVATTPTTSPPMQTRTATGDTVDSRYGTVQVQVTLRGSTITNVVAVQMPDSHQRSVEISQDSEPILHQEALQAQSAQIDIVSGATYTSEAYSQSLQSALAQARG